jgi:hypothetical protein
LSDFGLALGRSFPPHSVAAIRLDRSGKPILCRKLLSKVFSQGVVKAGAIERAWTGGTNPQNDDDLLDFRMSQVISGRQRGH